jgi:hypothetical protein
LKDLGITEEALDRYIEENIAKLERVGREKGVF